MNAYAAARIKKKLGIPYIVSMHINPDVDVRGRAKTLLHWLGSCLQQDVERIGLKDANLVMPVYRPIIPYLQRIGVKHYQVCYNALNSQNLRPKHDYSIGTPIRLISVGRQFREKNPDNIIRALVKINNAELTLVGDGPYHLALRKLARECGVENRVNFIASIHNDKLCDLLYKSDIFVVHSEYWEISKSVLEAMLTGLPVVINRRYGEAVPELVEDAICLMVENSANAYFEALKFLIDNDHEREFLGKRSCALAQSRWAPQKTEAKFVEIYREIIENSGVVC